MDRFGRMMYASVNEMATPASMAYGAKPGIGTHETMPDSVDGMAKALEAEMEKCARLQAEVAELKSELDKAKSRVAVQSRGIDALTNQLRDALSFEEAVATMQEFTRCSAEDQRFKKYILRRACTHLESVWEETKRQYPGEDGISGAPALIPSFEVERLVGEAVERIRKDAASYKF